MDLGHGRSSDQEKPLKKHGKIDAIYKSEARGDLMVLIFHKTPLARGQ